MRWLPRNIPEVLQAVWEHLTLSVASVAIALAISLVLGIWCARLPRVQAAVLGVTGALFVIPSLALFALLIPLLGIGTLPALVGLSSYCLLILVRNVVNGLQAVPREVLDAADGLGYSRIRRMREVELPLALPYIVAGVRLAMVTTIGIATIAAYINAGGLGAIIFAGIDQRYPEKILVGGGLVALLSVVTDTLLSRVERLVQA